jgi:hypothetical protein
MFTLMRKCCRAPRPEWDPRVPDWHDVRGLSALAVDGQLGFRGGFLEQLAQAVTGNVVLGLGPR